MARLKQKLLLHSPLILIEAYDLYVDESSLFPSLEKTIDMMKEKGFEEFIMLNSKDLSTCEYFIPTILSKYVENKLGDIKVLSTNDKWYGLTYKQDFENVCNGIDEMVKAGLYPKHLWY